MAERGDFAERLKALCAAAGLSQPALAERAGLSVSAVRQFEYGRREPAFGTLVKLAKGLGVSLAAFEDGPEAAKSGAPAEPERPHHKAKRPYAAPKTVQKPRRKAGE